MIENKKGMKIKKLIKYYIFGESLKEIEANRIINKINVGKKLTDKEKGFFDLYNHTNDDKRDFMYLSKNSTYVRIKELLSKNRIVICNLHDKNGKFGLEIRNVECLFDEEKCTIYMKGGEIHNLEDRFLYNIIYNNKSDEYSLEEQDEYFEKIEVRNDED